MKKLLIAFVAFPLFFASCISDSGPPGPPGQDGEDGIDGIDGEDGINILGQIFEVTVDFNSNNDYAEFVDIPDAIDVFDSDIIMVYILTDVVDGTDVWEPLPQTLFFGDQILLYGFNFTVVDVELFLDGTINLDDLNSDFTDGIVFRIAVLPADAVANIDLNTLSMEDLMGSMDKQEIIKLN